MIFMSDLTVHGIRLIMLISSVWEDQRKPLCDNYDITGWGGIYIVKSQGYECDILFLLLKTEAEGNKNFMRVEGI